MEADAVFPNGRPLRRAADSTGSKLVHTKHRRDTIAPVRYYFLDPGSSNMLGPEDKYRYVIGLKGQGRTAPELSLV